jgi:hypothetical protein
MNLYRARSTAVARGNVLKSLLALRATRHMSQRHTSDASAEAIAEADAVETLGLLEDMHRYDDRLRPRPTFPDPGEGTLRLNFFFFFFCI